MTSPSFKALNAISKMNPSAQALSLSASPVCPTQLPRVYILLNLTYPNVSFPPLPSQAGPSCSLPQLFSQLLRPKTLVSLSSCSLISHQIHQPYLSADYRIDPEFDNSSPPPVPTPCGSRLRWPTRIREEVCVSSLTSLTTFSQLSSQCCYKIKQIMSALC